MPEFELTHLSDAALLRDLASLINQKRMTTATLLAHFAEVDARRLYVPAGYSSMHAYCVGELRLSEDAAYKRIQAARACRQFPILFQEISRGRLHLAAVCLLAPHLKPENAEELIAAAVNRRKSEVEEWLARRFMDSRNPVRYPSTIRRVVPRGQRARSAIGDLLSSSQAPAENLGTESAPAGENLRMEPAFASEDLGTQPALANVGLGTGPALANQSLGLQLAPGQVGRGPDSSAPRIGPPPPVEPQVVERFEVRVTIDKATYERLRYAQTLMSHAIPDGDLGQILGRAVEALITMAERQKFGAKGQRVPSPIPSSRPSPPGDAATGTGPAGERIAGNASSAKPDRHRYIPADVRRAVWQRDQGQCTFISASGHRCQARRLLEFDHVEPLAFGGRSTVEGLRLRCRAHNQYEAERVFGRGFMTRKREGARGNGEAAGIGARESSSRNLPRGKLI